MTAASRQGPAARQNGTAGASGPADGQFGPSRSIRKLSWSLAAGYGSLTGYQNLFRLIYSGVTMNAQELLERPALVLNRAWAPIRMTSVRDAIGLVAKGAAKIIEPRTYETHDLRTWHEVSRAQARFAEAMIRSPRLALVPPEVILLTSYTGSGGRSVVFSRKNLFRRDHHTCQYCGGQPGPEALTIDHVVPRSRGGLSTWENCVLACVPCNARKADRSPEQSGLRLRKAPKRPTWKMLARCAPRERRESWEQFLSRAYWEVELEP